jgi:hypothetical protein
MKTCTSCGETKPTTEFYRSAACADGFQYHCKACDREKNRRWYKANPDKNRENSRRHHEENQEKINERRRQFFAANREKENERRRRWNEDNREKRREYLRQYRKKNGWKDREYARNRCQTDPAFRAASMFRTRFREWFKARGLKKNRRVLDAVGCTPEELVRHLESQFDPGMTRENWSADGWHIDHIIPIASAGDDIEGMTRLWHFSNLRPLWAQDNLRKGARA